MPTQNPYRRGNVSPSHNPQMGLLLGSAVLSAILVLVAVPVHPGVGESSEGQQANRLLTESSPYLQLHAHNPVDWFPWGEEAFAEARRENKPIFLSVGYSTCYWCHVMEREVFSDPVIARQMNEWFVSIKVDKEERPDIDEIYMAATQLLTGRGGWPNSVFLTPELKPFFAGTYFPPVDRGQLPGFPRVLERLHTAWQQQPEVVEARAAELFESLRGVLREGERSSTLDLAEVSAKAVQQLESQYDSVWGGFGKAPKFPMPTSLSLLWHQAELGDQKSREKVVQTLEKMGQGAIYDHLSGGFHRYTLDREWRVPHFEKMLYDNAQLAELTAIVASATGDPELERLARGTFEFVLEQMRLDNGAFKSAIDAETRGVEGAYYVWTRSQVQAALGEDGYRKLAPIFGFEAEPNFEAERYTLFFSSPLAEQARSRGIAEKELWEILEPGVSTLESVRAKREFPLVDDKVLTDWNGLMIAALARGGAALDEVRYIEAAAEAADFLLQLKDESGVLLHVWRAGEGRIRAFLDDYAFLIRGLLALEEATGDERWLEAAEALASQMETRLGDPLGGYFNSESDSALLVRSKTATDGAVPSGNGVAALGLLRLAARTGKVEYRQRATAAVRGFSQVLTVQPAAAPSLTLAASELSGSELAGQSVEPVSTTIPAGSSVGELAREVVSPRAGLDEAAQRGEWAGFWLTLSIREGWHLNANPASLEVLIPTRVEGAVRAMRYPAGRMLDLTFAGRPLSVYSGALALEGELADGETEVLLTYQACDDRRCLPAITREVTVEAP